MFKILVIKNLKLISRINNTQYRFENTNLTNQK